MDTVNERTTSRLTVAFADADGEPAVPATVTYRVDCLTTGEEVVADTALTPAASLALDLGASVQAMRGPGNRREVRRVTVSATYGDDDEAHAEYLYEVRDLGGVA